MVGYKKLVLIAAGALALAGSQASAAPMTEGTFVVYFAQSQQRWARGASFLMHFVHWRDDNPEWTVRNISWVERWTGDGGSVETPVWVQDPECANNGNDGWVDDRIPTWKRTNIPEPGTALLVSGVMGIVALRRRTI
jgi:hypothetical protein